VESAANFFGRQRLMFKGSVLLVSTNTDSNGDFAGCKVTLTIDHRVTDFRPADWGQMLPALSSGLSATVDQQNRATFAFPEKLSDLKAQLTIQVHSLAGSVLSEFRSDLQSLRAELRITLPSPPKPVFSSLTLNSLASAKRLRGQVFHKSSQVALAGLPIILWGKESATHSDQRREFSGETDLCNRISISNFTSGLPVIRAASS
jgi:hypothetical protein